MKNVNSAQKPKRWSQVVRILAPLFLLLLCIGALQIGPRPSISPDRTPAVTTTSPAQAVAAGQTIPTATPYPTIPPTPTLTAAVPTQNPTAAPSPTPLFPPGSQIQLLGPPNESRLGYDNFISFYWLWPLPLEEDQAFAVKAYSEEAVYLLGEVSEPNLGTAYHLQTTLADLELEVDEISWQVVLTSVGKNSETIDLLESQVRYLYLSTIP